MLDSGALAAILTISRCFLISQTTTAYDPYADHDQLQRCVCISAEIYGILRFDHSIPPSGSRYACNCGNVLHVLRADRGFATPGAALYVYDGKWCTLRADLCPTSPEAALCIQVKM